jgi:hypothetical protein
MPIRNEISKLTPPAATVLKDTKKVLQTAQASTLIFFFLLLQVSAVGRDSSVGIATRYGLDGPGIESRWGRDFPHLSRPALGPIQRPVQWVPGLFPVGKAAGTWRWPPTPSITAVKEKVELNLYSPSGPSWPVLGLPLPLPLHVSAHFSHSWVTCHCMSISSLHTVPILSRGNYGILSC